MAMCFDDIWTPESPLPGKRTLIALAERLGQAWGVAGLGASARIIYNPRLRSALGRAFLREGRVELNTRLLLEHPDQLLSTLAHELAHLVVHCRFGHVQPHGVHFRTLMRAVGFSPAATHRLPTEHLRRRRRKYVYLHRCSDCGYSFLARSVRRNCYCRACGPQMTWHVIRLADAAQGRAALRQVMSG